MKRTIVIVDLVILACLAGFFIGRGTSHQISKYDERAEKAWKKVAQADTPPVTEDSTQKQFEKVVKQTNMFEKTCNKQNIVTYICIVQKIM